MFIASVLFTASAFLFAAFWCLQETHRRGIARILPIAGALGFVAVIALIVASNMGWTWF